MNARTLTWMFVILSLIFLPAALTGCGADDADVAKKEGIYTVGPGNLGPNNGAEWDAFMHQISSGTR